MMGAVGIISSLTIICRKTDGRCSGWTGCCICILGTCVDGDTFVIPMPPKRWPVRLSIVGSSWTAVRGWVGRMLWRDWQWWRSCVEEELRRGGWFDGYCTPRRAWSNSAVASAPRRRADSICWRDGMFVVDDLGGWDGIDRLADEYRFNWRFVCCVLYRACVEKEDRDLLNDLLIESPLGLICGAISPTILYIFLWSHKNNRAIP